MAFNTRLRRRCKRPRARISWSTLIINYGGVFIVFDVKRLSGALSLPCVFGGTGGRSVGVAAAACWRAVVFGTSNFSVAGTGGDCTQPVPPARSPSRGGLRAAGFTVLCACARANNSTNLNYLCQFIRLRLLPLRQRSFQRACCVTVCVCVCAFLRMVGEQHWS